VTDDHAEIRELITDYALALDAGISRDACNCSPPMRKWLSTDGLSPDMMAFARCSPTATRLHLTESRGSTSTTTRDGPDPSPVRQGRRPAAAARVVRRRTDPRRWAVALPATAVPIHHQRWAVRSTGGGVLMTQRVALVTGAAGGQGWAIAKRLRAVGYSVAACDRRADEVVAAVGELADDQVIAVELDVTSPEQWTTAVRQVVDRFGSLSTLVNNAGVLHRASLTDETPRTSKTLGGLTVSVSSSACAPASISCARPSMRPSSTSAAPERSALPQHAAYGSSKWALRGLTQAAAAELGRPASASTRCSPVRSPLRCSTRPPRLGWSPPPCSAASAGPAKSPMPSHFWFPRRRHHHWFRTRRRRRTVPADQMSTNLSVVSSAPGRVPRAGNPVVPSWFNDFTIFDREDDVGGTWRINTYPGLACDVKSHLYSFSFDLNPNWSGCGRDSPRSWLTSSVAPTSTVCGRT